MFNQMGYPYNGYINPMSSAQQRLAQMEAQYGQLGPQGMGTYPQGGGGPLTAPQGPQAGLIRGRVVTSIDEVRGAMVDLDGGVHVFTDFGNHKIYTKQINLDGTATINTYVLENTPPAPDPSKWNEELSGKVGALTQRVEALENTLREVSFNVQPHANDGNVRKGK